MNKLKSIVFGLLTVTALTLFLTSCEKNIPIPAIEVVQEQFTNNLTGTQNCTQTINLNKGWNLISFDVTPEDDKITSVFSNLIETGNLQFIIAYEGSALMYNSNQPASLNTLKNVNDGSGYWVRVLTNDVLTAEGVCIADDFRKTWSNGWNLIAYIPDEPQSPTEYFAQEIANDNLLFVTGFENGAVSFNPNGPEFLNSLNAMKNGFGYWVKLSSAAGKTNINSTNVFSFINGTCNLPAGETINILNKANEVIATIKVVEGSYLMTTPIYGDDLTTTFKEGASKGEAFRFSWNKQIADVSTSFKGDYGLEKINLQFKVKP